MAFSGEYLWGPQDCMQTATLLSDYYDAVPPKVANMCTQYMLKNELTLLWFEETLERMGDELIIQIIDDQRQAKPVVLEEFSIYRECEERYEDCNC